MANAMIESAVGKECQSEISVLLGRLLNPVGLRIGFTTHSLGSSYGLETREQLTPWTGSIKRSTETTRWGGPMTSVSLSRTCLFTSGRLSDFDLQTFNNLWTPLRKNKG
jgi:hypothetical protein